MLYKIKIIDSTNFTSALKVTLAAVIPVLLFTFYGNFQMGFAMAGRNFCISSDIPSSIQHKIKGILVTSFFFSRDSIYWLISFILFLYFYPFSGFNLPYCHAVGIWTRANMVSFSCLVAVSLAFAVSARVGL
jgi:hypothetical protein